MIDIRKCKHHGVCTNCFKQQDGENTIYELRASTTGRGWTTIMLCRDCMIELMRKFLRQLMRKVRRSECTKDIAGPARHVRIAKTLQN